MADARKLIAGNWKMNGLAADGQALASDLAGRFRAGGLAAFDMVVCPPGPILRLVGGALGDSGIALGGQDCAAEAKGAFTGDTAAPMLVDAGCRYVILGHSERRHGHGEGDEMIRRKTEAAFTAGLVAIVCVGETEAERDAGRAEAVVEAQLAGSLPDAATSANTVIAYEPVWAIGTGKTATPEMAQEVHAMIRRKLAEFCGADAAGRIRILYGGSMKPENAEDLLKQPDIDGGLIGGASLKARSFLSLIETAGKRAE